MQKYTEIIISVYPFFLSVLSILMLIYSRVKGLKEESFIIFWKGTFLFSLSMLIPKLHFVLPNMPGFARILNVISFIPFIFGAYLLCKVIKADTIELKRNTAFAFGLISMLLVPIAGLVTLGLLLDSVTDPAQKWQGMLATVFSGTLSVFLSVVGRRLLKVRKGWKGNLFTPYSLWLQLPGCLFLIVGFIKLMQRNLTGLVAIAIAVALLVTSSRKKASQRQTEPFV
ncbi:MAG: hypothetical protein Q8K68_07455 [Nitrospirota bacterium]|nr:hypothetical protein [Nitrospirota bacterium]